MSPRSARSDEAERADSSELDDLDDAHSEDPAEDRASHRWWMLDDLDESSPDDDYNFKDLRSNSTGT